jgi:putative ABC transport system permease protein
MQWLVDILGQIFSTLWSHKLRSFLTMFGIAWGVGSLLLLLGLGEGFRSGNQKRLDTVGENVMFIFGGRIPAGNNSMLASRYYHLTYDDYRSLLQQEHIAAATPVISRGDLHLASDWGTSNGQVFGIEPAFQKIRTTPLAQGRLLNDLDVDQKRPVAVIGTEMVRILFPGRPAVGGTILINGLRFEVVGTLKMIGRGKNINDNQRVLIPFTEMRENFPLTGEGNREALSYINFQPRERSMHWYAKSEARMAIAANHRFDPQTPDAFDDWDSLETAETIGKLSDAMNTFLGAVGLVTLGLGAIGVVNIMLVNVSERTREIGLRKALGATSRNILFHFFLEGLIITGLSGLAGLAGAWGVTRLLALLPPMEGFDMPHIVPLSAAMAMGGLALAGIFAGLYPARQAAKLQPVEALRAE